MCVRQGEIEIKTCKLWLGKKGMQEELKAVGK